MATSGGGGVKPSQAQQIVKEMMEGDKNKKLDANQQSTQLREQARTQEGLREGAQKKLTEDQGQSERAEGKKGEAAKARARSGPRDVRSKAERQMDGFLNRQSTQSKQRDAGRSYNLNRNQDSRSAQAWSVLNSPQTPPKARQAMLARQPKSPNAGQSSSRATTSRTFQATQQGRPSTPRTAQAFQRTTSQAAAFREPQIRYTQPRTPPQQRGGRLPMQRNLASTLLSRQLGKLALSQQGKAATQNAPPVQVHIRGNVVFIKDGPKLRAFKMDKDGNLEELPTENSSEEPLSPEAKAQLRKVLRQRGLQSGQRGLSEDSGKVSEEGMEQVGTEEESAAGEEGLDVETRFALLLYEALEENKKFGRRLRGGENPEFPDKKDWAAFFAKMLKLGNQETSSKKALDDILSMLFRGIFDKKGKGKYFVGDLKYEQSGKGRTEKFAQVQVMNDQLLALLAKLRPGQAIDAEMLRQFFGQEMNFLKMAHSEQKAFNMAEGAERNVQFNPKGNVDPYSQARLESAMFGRRGQRAESASGRKESTADLYPSPGHQGVFANVYELLGLRRLYEGNPKRYTAIAYFLMASGVGLATLLVLLKFV